MVGKIDKKSNFLNFQYFLKIPSASENIHFKYLLTHFPIKYRGNWGKYFFQNFILDFQKRVTLCVFRYRSGDITIHFFLIRTNQILSYVPNNFSTKYHENWSWLKNTAFSELLSKWRHARMFFYFLFIFFIFFTTFFEHPKCD